MTMASDRSSAKPEGLAFRQLLAVAALIAAMTVLRVVYASVIDLRTDEAYYWTWSKENVLSFLDHPPMVAYLIRPFAWGTANPIWIRLPFLLCGVIATLAAARRPISRQSSTKRAQTLRSARPLSLRKSAIVL